MSFFAELSRRNVFRVVIAYLAGAWLLVQIADVAVPAFGLPDSAVGVLIIILGVGLIPAAVLAWVFEFTPEGIVRDGDAASADVPGAHKTADRVIMAVLAIAVGFFAIDKFVLDPARDQAREQQVAEEAVSRARVESFGDKSIAVLPFANMSPDPEQVYFSDGIAEEILNLLARIGDLRVISRSTSFGYRGDVKVGQVANELNVSYVLEGSVRKAGNTVRVTAQLIDARADAHVWSDTWDRELDDIFAIQDEVAGHIAEELELRLMKPRGPRQKTDPETYALFLKARHDFYIEPGNDADYTHTIEMLRNAIERDPAFVPAMTLLTFVLARQSEVQVLSPRQNEAINIERGQLIERAYVLQPDDAVANLYKGYLEFMKTGDDAKALAYLQRSLELEPSNMEVLRFTGYVARNYGRLDDAVTLFRQALARDPSCIPCSSGLHHTLVWMGQFEEAEAVLRRRIALTNDFGAHVNRGIVLIELGRAEESLEIFDEWEPGEAQRAAFKTQALDALGRREEADEMIEAWRDRWLEKLGPMVLADIYAGRLDAEGTIGFLKIMMTATPWGFKNIAWDRRFEFLHGTDEWQKWRKQAGLDEETLAGIEITLPDFAAVEPTTP